MKYWIYLILSFFSVSLFAEEVSLPKAQRWAQSFFSNQLGSRGASVKLSMVWDGEDAHSRGNGHPAFYVFNREDQRGFVVVSADDLVQPLIGYSFSNSFEMENLPVNIRTWLMGKKYEINYMRKNHTVPTRLAATSWTMSAPSVGKVIKSIPTAQWNQGAPFNDKCPIDEYTGRRSVTGCTATAFAIALKARQWPDAGIGVVGSYTYKDSQGKEVVTEEHPLGHKYEWDKMPMELSFHSSDEEKEAVATLMLDCGRMCQSVYSSHETGGFVHVVAKSMRDHLKYSTNVEFESREYYSTTTWNAMLQKELNENGPVIYAGQSKGGGHAFILDGYTDTDYYSVNWGWGGVCNGYYVLSLLNPDEQGIGGSETNDGYNFMQDAILSVKKATPDEVFSKYPNYHLTSVDYKNYYYGIVPTTNQIKKGEPFVIDRISILNISGRGMSDVDAVISVFNKDGIHKENVSDLISMKDLEEYYYLLGSSVECLITKEIEMGDYLAVGFKPKGCEEWKEMKGGFNTQSRIPLLTDNFATSQDVLILTSGEQYDDVYWGMKSSRKVIKKDEEFFVKTGYICNTDNEVFKGKLSVGHYSKSGTLKENITSSLVSLTPPLKTGHYTETTINSCVVKTDIEEGDYIALCYKSETDNTWKRIPPITGVTGRIALQPAGSDPVLENVTSFHFSKKDQLITLSTLKGVTFELMNEDNAMVTSGKADNGKIQIHTAELTKGQYKLKLSFGDQVKVIGVKL